MKYNIFISYPSSETDIVENLKAQFSNYGVNAWVYSIDRTLAVDTWEEIKEKLGESDLVIFIISNDTPRSEGQQTELKQALEKVNIISGYEMIMPIFISGVDPSHCPKELRNKNGEFLDAYSVKSVALKITKRIFPTLMKEDLEKSWKYPSPGEWLEVSNLDGIIEQYFDLGDKLYFRAISPMGLFECYAPKINGLFWIGPENVMACSDIELCKELEVKVPKKYQIIGMLDIQRLGWEAFNEDNKPDLK